MKKTIMDIELRGKKVLVRVDFNVPRDDQGNITDDYRIRSALPTLDYIADQEAKLILLSHLGRPEGPDPKESLKPVARRLSELTGRPVKFLDDCVGEEVESAVEAMKPRDVILLENVRFHGKKETKNDKEFAKALARLGDVFVLDGFAVAHRSQASVVGVAEFLPSVAGLLLAKELKHLGELLSAPEKPYVAILGGAKVSDKTPLVENLLGKLDRILIGGGMAYTFLKAQGVEVGNSKVIEEDIETARRVLRKADEMGVNILLPVDHIVAAEISDTAPAKVVQDFVPEGFLGLDIGPKTVEKFKEALKDAKTVVWNGPLGVFERKPFEAGTKQIAQYLASLDAKVVVGGGDTASAVRKFGVAESLTHVSTGGGASVEFLEGKELPGLAVLPDKDK